MADDPLPCPEAFPVGDPPKSERLLSLAEAASDSTLRGVHDAEGRRMVPRAELARAGLLVEPGKPGSPGGELNVWREIAERERTRAEVAEAQAVELRVTLAGIAQAGPLRALPGEALRGLEWLARVGPAPVEAWAVGMGWAVGRAFSYAERLERAGWLSHTPTVFGEGSLLWASREGLGVLGSGLSPAPAPAAMWWAHLRGCAWAAAWLCARGRSMQAPREVMVDPLWVGGVRWRDGRGEHRSGHRPDLAWITRAGPRVAVEVELARKSTPRLEAIVGLHARWYQGGKSGGVIYVCADEGVCGRVVAIAAARGLSVQKGGGLQVMTLVDVLGEAFEAWAARPRQAAQRGSSGSPAQANPSETGL